MAGSYTPSGSGGGNWIGLGGGGGSLLRHGKMHRLEANLSVRNNMRAGLDSGARETERFFGAISRQGRLFGVGFGAAMRGSMVAAGAAAVTIGAQMASQLVGEFATVEKAWIDVTTLMPDLTKKATDQMFTDMRDFAKKTGFSIQETMRSAYQTVSAGIDPLQTESFMETAAKAARAGVAGLEKTTVLLASVLNAYGESVQKVDEYSDALFTTVRYGVTTFEQLTSAMGTVTPMAASLGVTFNDVNAAVATLTRTGITAAQATTYLRRALVELSREEGKAGKFFKETAGVTFPEFIAQGHNLVEVFKLIGDEADRQGKVMTDVFSRVEGGQAGVILATKRFSDEYKVYMNNLAGSTQEAYDKHEQSTYLALEKVKAWWADVQLVIGDGLDDLAVAFGEVIGVVENSAIESAKRVLVYMDETKERIREILGLAGIIPPTSPRGAANVYYSGAEISPGWDTAIVDIANYPFMESERLAAYEQYKQEPGFNLLRAQRGIDDPNIQIRLAEIMAENRQQVVDRIHLDTYYSRWARNPREFPLRSSPVSGNPFQQAASQFGPGGLSAVGGGSYASWDDYYNQLARENAARQQELQRLSDTDPLVGTAGFAFDLDNPATRWWNRLLRGELGLDDETVKGNTKALQENTEALKENSEQLIEVIYNPTVTGARQIRATDDRILTMLTAANIGRHVLTRIPQ